MPVIAVVNQKGGVGKTSLATNLGSALGRDDPVLLLDSDPQRSASGWFALAPEGHLQLTGQGAEEGPLTRQVRAAVAEYQWVVIDCPPGITRINAEAIRASDVVPHTLQAPSLGRMGLSGHRRCR